MEQFWHRATQIMASGELAVLGTVIRVTRQVPRVSPPGACVLVTARDIIGGLGGPHTSAQPVRAAYDKPMRY